MLHFGRRQAISFACGSALWTGVAFAQKPGRPLRVGWLGWTGASGVAPSPAALAAFRAGLAARGWQEGRDLLIEVRSGEGSRSRELTAELVRSELDVLVAQGPMVFGARSAAGAVPIVFSINGDPVEAGLVGSLSRPGANLTGVTALSAELAGKRVQLVKEIIPRVTHFAAIANQSHPGVQTEFDASHAAARVLGVSLQWFAVHSAADFGQALEGVARGGAGGLIAIPDNLINQHAGAIAEFSARRRIPAISGWSEFVEAGNLLSYGPGVASYYRRVAVYVDKLLRGARPADLPVEQPTEFEMVLNLRAARSIGLQVPQSLRVRAERVIS